MILIVHIFMIVNKLCLKKKKKKKEIHSTINIGRRREAQNKNKIREKPLDDLPGTDEKGTSDEHRNCFKGKVGKTSERQGEAHNYGLSERTHTVLN